MKVKDYYKILEVQRTASAAQIKYAYHRMARKFHPDLNQDDPRCIEKFNDISEAYNVLGNLDNRLDYHLLLYQIDEIKQEAKRKLAMMKKNEKKKKKLKPEIYN